MKSKLAAKIAATVGVAGGLLLGIAGPAQASVYGPVSAYSTDNGNYTNGGVTWYSDNLYYFDFTVKDNASDGKAPRVWVHTQADGGAVPDEVDYAVCSSGFGSTCSYTTSSAISNIFQVDIFVCNGGSSTSKQNCRVRVLPNPY